MSSDNSLEDQKKYIMYYLLSAGIFGFCSMIAMLFFDFKPEEKEGEKDEFGRTKLIDAHQDADYYQK